MKRKMSLVVLMAAICGFVLAGCDNNSSTTPPASTNAPATPAPPSTNAPH